MARECLMYWRQEKLAQSFGEETSRKDMPLMPRFRWQYGIKVNRKGI
jgi:hypothetical protein